LAKYFEDERGVIQDLLGPVDAVTEILTRKGAVRGNHVHHQTTQWAYVVSGRLLIATSPFRTGGGRKYLGAGETVYDPGMMAVDEPGIAHAWKALEDTVVLVFTKGPRSGEAYESDTQRLEVPLL
jgi:dTDP-4-dehydrorhamnose 3,5-epimerase-like enzyme